MFAVNLYLAACTDLRWAQTLITFLPWLTTISATPNANPSPFRPV